MKLTKEGLQNFAFISKRVFLSFLVCFLGSGLISALVTLLEIDAPGLEWMGTMLLAISFLLLAISWITPGVLMIAGAPELGLVWLRGMNWIPASVKPWAQLSSGERVSIYCAAAVLAVLTAVAISFWLL